MPSAAQKRRNKKNRLKVKRQEQAIELINTRDKDKEIRINNEKINNFKYDLSLLKESPLGDDYPVYWDYFYLINGNRFRSDIKGTIRDLKADYFKVKGVKAITVNRYDKYGRIDQLKNAGLIKD